MDRYHEGTHGPRTVAVIGELWLITRMPAASRPLPAGWSANRANERRHAHCALPMCTLYYVYG